MRPRIQGGDNMLFLPRSFGGATESRRPVAAKLGLLAWVVGLELVPYAARHFAGFTDAGPR